jgi:hypothetical protein
MMNCSKRFFEIILLFLVISFFSFNTTSFISIIIKKILYNDIGFCLSLLVAIYFVVKKEFIYLAILLFIIMKHSKIIEGAGEADDDEKKKDDDNDDDDDDDDDEDTSKEAKKNTKEEAEALKEDLGVDDNMFNDGDKIESFWDLLGQAKRNADKILNSASTM